MSRRRARLAAKVGGIDPIEYAPAFVHQMVKSPAREIDSERFSDSPRLVRAGIVTIDPYTAAVQSVIALQYNPDSLSRTLQFQALPGGQDGVRVDALRLRGPPSKPSRSKLSSTPPINWNSRIKIRCGAVRSAPAVGAIRDAGKSDNRDAGLR